MDLTESARRRGLGLIGVILVLGSALVAALVWRPLEPDLRREQEQLRTMDVAQSPPPIDYQPSSVPAAPPPPPSAMPAPPVAAPTAPLARPEEGGSRMAPSPPNVAPTAAPGVAFNYRYAFRLPGQRVSEVQEQHARACEQLGVSRCRIIGMRYRVVNDRDVEAMLAFKLAPSIARRFGQAGTELVARSEGMLFDSELSGTVVGTASRATGRSIAEMSEDLERVEARLRQRGLSVGERMQAEDEAQQLRQSIRAARANREDQQESLATTPVVFQYASGDLVPSFDTRPSLARAASRAWDNLLAGLSLIMIMLVTLLPWLAIGLVAWWLGRALMRRLRFAEPRSDAAPATAVN